MITLFSSLAPVNANPSFGRGILRAARPAKQSPAPARKPAAPRKGFYDRDGRFYVPSVDEDRWNAEDLARRDVERYDAHLEAMATEAERSDRLSLAFNPAALGLIP